MTTHESCIYYQYQFGFRFRLAHEIRVFSLAESLKTHHAIFVRMSVPPRQCVIGRES